MCGHQWVKHEDVKVCILCGVTVTFDGKLVFDRRLPGVLARVAKPKRRRVKRRKA